jgi:cell division protein FtsA
MLYRKVIDKNTSIINVADIGSSKLVVISAQVFADGRMDILGIGIATSKGVHKGMIVDMEAFIRSLSRALAEAEKFAGHKVQQLYVSIAGAHISTTRVQHQVTLNNQTITAATMHRILSKAADSLHLLGSRSVLGVMPESFSLDGQSGIRNPQGMQANTVAVTATVMHVAYAARQTLQRCFRRCGLAMQGLVLQQLAASYFTLTAEEKLRGVILVEMGSGTTNVAVFRAGVMQYAFTLPIGGYQVSNDLAAVLGVSLEQAEAIKLKYGCVLTELADAELIIEPTNGHKQGLMAEVMRLRYQEILHLVLANLEKRGHLQPALAGIVLSGGAAIVSGLKELLAETYAGPVRLATLQLPCRVAEPLLSIAFASSFGLLQHALELEQAALNTMNWRALLRHMTNIKNWIQCHF